MIRPGGQENDLFPQSYSASRELPHVCIFRSELDMSGQSHNRWIVLQGGIKLT